MFACPACTVQLTFAPPVVAAPAYAVGTMVLVKYEEAVPIDSSDEETDDEVSAAPAIVLSVLPAAKLTIAWLLPVNDVTLAAGHRRPTRWQSRGPTTHVLDCNTLAVNAADVTLHPDVANFVIEPAVVYDSATSAIVTDTTYAAFLGANMVVK